MNPVPNILLFLGLWLLAVPSMAQEEAPTIIEADSAEINEATGISTYTGNVIITQGGVRVEADVVIAYTREGELLRIEGEGKPVKFVQKQPNEPTIRGHSLAMDYDAKTERLLLLKEAELWQDGNHFQGDRIQYDVQEKKTLATSSRPEAGGEKQRVQITIQPKKDTGATPNP